MHDELKLLHQHLQFFIIRFLSLDLSDLDFCLVSLSLFLRIMWLTTDGLLSRGNHKTNWFQNGYIDPCSLHKEFSAVCVLIHWKWKTDTQISTHHSIYFCTKSSTMYIHIYIGYRWWYQGEVWHYNTMRTISFGWGQSIRHNECITIFWRILN